jgi:MinD superfamily P-loop ATPase
MITAVRDADFVLLVTEPTPFGLHDLTLAVETLRQLKLPFGVILNRCDIGDQGVVNYCHQESITIMLQIPDARQVAVAYSRGKGLLDALPDLKPQLQRLLNTISQRQHGGQI